MVTGSFAFVALFYVALSGFLCFNSRGSAINLKNAASDRLSVQIFEDFDASDLTKLIEAKERAQRHISENDIVAKFAEEAANPHLLKIPHVHWQEFIDNRSSFIERLQYRPPNCGQPFDVFHLLDLVQDARRLEQQRIIQAHTVAPECSLRNCQTRAPCTGRSTTPVCRASKFTDKAGSNGTGAPVVTVGQNKLWNNHKVKESNVADKERHRVLSNEPAGVLEDGTKQSVPALIRKQFPVDLSKQKQKQLKQNSDQMIWQSPFQQRQSHKSVEQSGKRLSTELRNDHIDRFYSPEQNREFPGSLRKKRKYKSAK